MKLHTLLFIAILIVTAIYIPRTRYAPGTSDAYWHMAIGRYVWETKTIPKKSPFVFAYENTNFVSTEWLAGLISYLATLSPLGLGAIYVLRSTITIATLILLKLTLNIVFNFAKRNTSNQWLNNAAIALTALLLGIRAATDRPENISYLFLAYINYVGFFFYKTGKISKLAWGLPLIFVAWPNIHAFGIIGTALLLAFVIASWLKRKQSIWIFSGLSLVSIVVATIQFNRFFYFLMVRHTGPFDIKELASLPSRLSEIKFNPLNQTPAEIYLFFLVLIFYLIFIPFYVFKGKSSLHSKIIVLFFLATILAPFKYFRLITPAVLLALPQLVEMVDTFIKNQKVKSLVSVFVLTICILWMLWSIPLGFILGSRSTWQYISDLSNEQHKIIGVRNHSWTDEYPYKTNKAIDEFLAPKRIFTNNPWRNYYIWYYPQVKIPSDVIFEYQTKQGFDDEEKVRFGNENWQEILEKYNVDTVINAPFETSFTNVTPVNKLPNWKLIYVDEISYIYAKAEAIKKDPLELSLLQPEQNTSVKFNREKAEDAAKQLQSLLDFDQSNLFARQQLILYHMDIKKDYQKAYELSRESYNLAPKYPYFSLYFAKSSALLGNCTQAKNWAEETKKSSFNDIIFGDMIKNALSTCK